MVDAKGRPERQEEERETKEKEESGVKRESRAQEIETNRRQAENGNK